MRIATAGIATESCTFSPLPTRQEDFIELRGDELRARYPFLAKQDGVSLTPLLHASALPGGPVERKAYEAFKAEILAGLRSHGAWDGVYLDLHGALYVAGQEDAEGDFVAAVRKTVGPDCLIAASYDLHGNLSARVMRHLNLVTAYRTAPHVDAEETRERAGRLLLDCLRSGIRPLKAFVPVPITLPGERAMTTAEPAASLYGLIPQLVDLPGMLDASVLVGYTWADEPRVGASTVAVGVDQTAVRRAAETLAAAYWEARHAFDFSMPTGTVDECLDLALNAAEPCVFLSDAGDNITGGGVGDVPAVLDRLLHHEVPAVYASLVDPAAVSICTAVGAGETVSLTVGGKLDTTHGRPLPVEGRVLWLDPPEAPNRHAVVAVGGVKVILTEARTAFTTEAQFRRLGIDPLAHRIVVVKLGYLFPDLRRIAPKSVLAFSPGAINPDITALPYQRLRRPIFPLDGDMTWDVGSHNRT